MIMRPVLALLTLLFIWGCNAKSALISEQKFARLFLDSLRHRYPTVSFTLNADLTITAKKDSLDFKYYLNNAYTTYKAEPDSVNAVISRYMASTADLYEGVKPVSTDNIIPVIKPVEYLDDLKKDGKSFAMITERYDDQLIIAYAVNSQNSVRYLTENDFKTLSVSMDTLRAIAFRNFDKIMSDIQRRENNGVFLVEAGGFYEASLMLLPSVWTKENFPVEGDLIIAIPNRDMLLVTGSRNKNGINTIREIAADSYKTGSYQVSERLYKWTGKKFEKYD